jgi:hypothetical protein
VDESGQAGDAGPARRDGRDSGWPAADQVPVEQRSRYADLLAAGPSPDSAPPYPYEGDLDDRQPSHEVPPGFRARHERAPVVPGERSTVAPVRGSASERDAHREAPDWPAWTPRSPERHWSSTWSPGWSRTEQPGPEPSPDPAGADDLPASFPVSQPHRRGLSRRFGADWDDRDEPAVRPAGDGATGAVPPPAPLPEEHPTRATSAWGAAPEPSRPPGSANGSGPTGEQPALPPGFASAPPARAVPRQPQPPRGGFGQTAFAPASPEPGYGPSASPVSPAEVGRRRADAPPEPGYGPPPGPVSPEGIGRGRAHAPPEPGYGPPPPVSPAQTAFGQIGHEAGTDRVPTQRGYVSPDPPTAGGFGRPDQRPTPAPERFGAARGTADAPDGSRAEHSDPPWEGSYRHADVDRDPAVGEGGFPAASSALRTEVGFGREADQASFPAAAAPVSPARDGFGRSAERASSPAAAPGPPARDAFGDDGEADVPRAAAPVSPARVGLPAATSDQPTRPVDPGLGSALTGFPPVASAVFPGHVAAPEDAIERAGPASPVSPVRAGYPRGVAGEVARQAFFPQTSSDQPTGHDPDRLDHRQAPRPTGHPQVPTAQAGHAPADPGDVAGRAGHVQADHDEAAERPGEPPLSAGQKIEARPDPGRDLGHGAYAQPPTARAGYAGADRGHVAEQAGLPPTSSGPPSDAGFGQPDRGSAAGEGRYRQPPTAETGFAPGSPGRATLAGFGDPDLGHVTWRPAVPASSDLRTEVGVGWPDRGPLPEQAGDPRADRGHGQLGVAPSSERPAGAGSRPDGGRAPEQAGDARADADEMAGRRSLPSESSEQPAAPGSGRLDRGPARLGDERVERDTAADPTDATTREREHTGVTASQAAPELGLTTGAPEQPRDHDGTSARSPRAEPAVAPEFTSLESIGRGLGPRPRPEDTLVQPDANGRRTGPDPVGRTGWPPASSQWSPTRPSSRAAAGSAEERRQTTAHPEAVSGRASVRPPTDEQLPQRVPAEPDVPTVPEPPSDVPADPPQLARIATHLRRDDVPPQHRDRPEGFDVRAILAAVRGVAGVRDASLRTTPAGAHSLRLDLSDGADPAEVSRHVARLLQETMGLAAAPQNLPVPSPDASAQPTGFTSSELAATAREETQLVQQALDGPRRRRQGPTHRGRAPVAQRRAQPTEPVAPAAPHEPGIDAFPALGAAAGIVGAVSGIPVTAAAAYAGGHYAPAAEPTPSRPLAPGAVPGPRVVIDHVQVSTFGLDATVEVRLAAGAQRAAGMATGPAVDGYVLRLCAVSAASAIDELLRRSDRVGDRGRCFVEHAAVVPFGGCEVAVVVVLLVCAGWVEQLAGSALVSGDPRQAVVRATLGAVNRRLEALLS